MEADLQTDQDVPIVDAHHHLYPHDHWSDSGPYLLPEFAADIATGHSVVSTIYVECGQLYRRTGPEALRGAGEAEFAAVMGRLSDTGHFGDARVCEAFVGRADLAAGDAIEDALNEMAEASDGRLRGIRSPAIWDADPLVNPSGRNLAAPGLMNEPGFRRGLSRLTKQGLVYDAWQFYPQLSELAALADAVPNSTIVCGHCGGLIGNRAYATADNFENWKTRVVELARHENVVMKLGGLANARTGFGFETRAERPTPDELVTLWSPYIETCIEAFGVDRCMFESNFPVDQIAADYRTLWDVYKRIVAGASLDEKRELFAGTARRIYKL